MTLTSGKIWPRGHQVKLHILDQSKMSFYKDKYLNKNI